MLSILTRYYLHLLTVLLLIYSINIHWKNNQWPQVLKSDARGYYAYLPAVFIYHDLNFGFYETVELKNEYARITATDYRMPFTQGTVNKYYCGEALLVSPFFLGSHLTANLVGSDSNGYSRPYMMGVTLAALFYLVLGLLYLHRTLVLYQIKPLHITLAVTGLVTGTHLFYYTVGEPGISHVYSFSMVCIFIYHVRSYFIFNKTKHVYLAALFLGLIVLIRPVNLLVIFSVPFLSTDKNNFLQGVRSFFITYKLLFLSLLIFLSIVSIQLIIYKIQTGHFFIYSYATEGFDFGQGKMMDFLFSYRKGFFLYTPLCLLALAGWLAVNPQKFHIVSGVLFLCLVVYVLSSWWMWYYGGSFSSRVMVEYLPFFALFIALTLSKLRTVWKRITYLILAGMFILVNQIQTLQYRYNVIHWMDMDKKKYWNVFLDLGPVFERRNEIR